MVPAVTVDVPEGTPVPADRLHRRWIWGSRRSPRSDPALTYSGKPVSGVVASTTSSANGSSTKNTRGPRRRSSGSARKEARFRKHENHVISKAIVETAKGTGRGLAVEDLSGIRDRLPAWGRDARHRLSGWSFGQLIAFLSYKAALAGVTHRQGGPSRYVRDVLGCGHFAKDNRKSQEKFLCVSCGMSMNADKNAALNIRAQALRKRALELDSPAG